MDQAQNLRNIIKKENTLMPMSRVITVTSGKGGVGKSNLAVNIAIAMGRAGKRVIILDADFGLANIEVMLGIRPKYNLADLMFKGKQITDIITEGPENVSFISGGSGIQELTNLTKEQVINFSSKLEELDRRADVIIVDTGAGISGNVMEFVMSSAEVILVATPEPTSMTDAYALLKTLDRQPEFAREHCRIKLVANRVSNEKMGKELYEKLSLVAEKFLNLSLEYIGSVPTDMNINKAVMKQKPITIAFPMSPASRAIEEISKKVLYTGEEEKKKRKTGLASLFAETIRRTLRR